VSDPVIIAIIGAIAGALPTVATIITAILQDRSSKKNFAKQSILNLINEDKTEALYGNMPDNYQNVLHEFDIYSKNGGNSYVAGKVDDYKRWYTDWQKVHIDKKCNV
jgi:archaellum component FlaG (FlaF/FlaG flagellin family)